MSSEDKTKTLIHELMHIPKSFGGGFIHHNIVHERNVDRMYQHYCNLKKRDNSFDNSFENIQLRNKEVIERPNKYYEDKDNKIIIIKKKRDWWF